MQKIWLLTYLEGREGVVVEAGGVVEQQQLISEQTVLFICERNSQLLLSINQHLHTLQHTSE